MSTLIEEARKLKLLKKKAKRKAKTSKRQNVKMSSVWSRDFLFTLGWRRRQTHRHPAALAIEAANAIKTINSNSNANANACIQSLAAMSPADEPNVPTQDAMGENGRSMWVLGGTPASRMVKSASEPSLPSLGSLAKHRPRLARAEDCSESQDTCTPPASPVELDVDDDTSRCNTPAVMLSYDDITCSANSSGHATPPNTNSMPLSISASERDMSHANESEPEGDAGDAKDANECIFLDNVGWLQSCALRREARPGIASLELTQGGDTSGCEETHTSRSGLASWFVPVLTHASSVLIGAAFMWAFRDARASSSKSYTR